MRKCNRCAAVRRCKVICCVVSLAELTGRREDKLVSRKDVKFPQVASSEGRRASSTVSVTSEAIDVVEVRQL